MSLRLNNEALVSVVREMVGQTNLNGEVLYSALEEGLKTVYQKRFGYDRIFAKVNRDTGSSNVLQEVIVSDDASTSVVEIEGEDKEIQTYRTIGVKEAHMFDPDAKPGDVVLEALPLSDISRSEMTLLRSVLSQQIYRAKALRLYEEFKDKVGQVIFGIVKRIEDNGILIDSIGHELFLTRRNMVKGERFKVGDRIKVYVESVSDDDGNFYVNISRIHDDFLTKVMQMDEGITSGKVKIYRAVRDPGSKAKVAVYSSEQHIDPVGACIGVKGSKIQNINAEFHGEKIEIVRYSPDVAQFVMNAFSPIPLTKIVLDNEKKKIDVVVPDDQLSKAIGRRGQNVWLISKLCDYEIDLKGESSEAEYRQNEFSRISQMFVDKLDVEEVIAQLLFSSNFTCLEDVAFCHPDALLSVEHFDSELVEVLQSRAQQYLENEQEELQRKISSHQITDDFSEFINNNRVLALLADNNVKCMEDFAWLSNGECAEIVGGNDISGVSINDMIINARERLGWLDEDE